MPEMDGYETVSFMRQEEATRFLPVIFLSAIYSSDYFKTKGIEVGAVDFITKPFPPSVLLGKVRVFLDLYRQRRALAEHRDHLSQMVEEATQELRQEKERAQQYLDVAGVILLATDADGIVTMINPRGVDILGAPAEDIIGKHWAKSFAMPDHHSVFPSDSEFACQYRESTVCAVDGRLRLIAWHDVPLYDADGNPAGMLSSGEDVTVQRDLEKQLQQSQKLESIGTLAGGVAHDFNNLLMGIDGYVFLLKDEINTEEGEECLGEIGKCVKSAADLTRQLLAFARQEPIAPQVINLNESISLMCKILQRLISENIRLEWLPGTDLHPVKLDPGQVDQILTNLCVNARDAINGDGKITISTCNRVLDDQDDSSLQLVSGNYVSISVRDTGCGMDTELQERIFEPFFTTKEVGKGTGLGLSTVYGIVKQNHGHIQVESTPGEGTAIQILLPSCAAPENAPEGAPLELSSARNEKVLLVEDNDEVRRVARAYLKDLGYRVVETAFPVDALQLVDSHPDIDLLLSDVVMPVMSGRELAEKVSSVLPEVKVLFMSGYTADIITSHGVSHGGVHLLSKPFSRNTLAKKVREVLEED